MSKMGLILLALYFVGCGNSPDHPEGPLVESEGDTNSRTEEPSERNFQVGTHPLGQDQLESFAPVDSGESIQVVYGPQGAYMVILALYLEEWTSPKATISVSAIWEDDVVASLFYPDLQVVLNATGAYARNLFVLTNGWENYVGQEIQLEVTVEGEGEWGDMSLTVLFGEPAPLYDL